MYSLKKISYHACSEKDKYYYDNLETLKVDIRPCCIDVIRYQKKKSKLDIADNDSDVKLMNDEDYTMSEKAAANGHLMCLAFAEVCGYPWTHTIRAEAAKNEIKGHKNNRFRSFDEVVCLVAARNNRLECLVYLQANGCLWDVSTCEAAARNGNMDILRYAHENGCPWDEFTCVAAAQNGNMDILRYAHEHGCPWSEDTCYAAVVGGNIDVLRYAHKNGCPWSENMGDLAIALGHINLLRYAYKHVPSYDKFPCDAAARNVQVSCLEYTVKDECLELEVSVQEWPE